MLDLIFLIFEKSIEFFSDGFEKIVTITTKTFYSILSKITGKSYYAYYSDYQYYLKGLDMMVNFILTIAIMLVAFLVIMLFLEMTYDLIVNLKTKEKIKEERVMTLKNKSYTPSSIRLIPTGKCLVPVTTPEKFNIKLRDENGYKTINNKKVYYDYEIGDSLTLVLEVSKDKYGRVIDEEVLYAK